MRIAILGGTRFIGVALVEELLAFGHEPLVLHRGKNEAEDQPQAAHVHLDRFKTDELRAAIADFAAEGFVDTSAYSGRDAEAAIAALPKGIVSVVLSSQDVYRAFFTLTQLGDGAAVDPVPLDEDSPTRGPDQRYLFRGQPPIEGSAEDNELYENLDVEAAYCAHGATILRLPVVYGERDQVRREEFILRRLRAGRTQIPIGTANLLWSRAYVRDVAAAIRLAVERPPDAGTILNIAERRTWTCAEWARQIVIAADGDAELVRVADAAVPDDLSLTTFIAQPLLTSSARARELLGWADSDPLDCLRASVQWHLRNPPAHVDRDFSADDTALAQATGSAAA